MSNNDSPITPPPALVKQWRSQWMAADGCTDSYQNIATQAARWGSDQQLETIKHWLITGPYGASIVKGSPTLVADLCEACRPKPPTLKEQALKAIGVPAKIGEARVIEHREHELIRRALEQLPD